MPSTINGIGTHYYGKKNQSQRTAPCPHCGEMVELSSYDTRLWGVFVFIPVIPLGRKRIIDQCPRCTHHGALPLDEYEQLREEGIRKAMAEFKAAPGDEAKAIELHGTLVSFGQREKAEQLLNHIKTRFPHSVDALVYVGAFMHFQGLPREAREYYRRAHEIDPKHPAARVEIAFELIESGDLDGAREMIRFLEEPDAPLEPGVQIALAGAYQARGRHDDSLNLLKAVLAKAPGLAGVKEVREMYVASERALGVEGTSLPPGPKTGSPGKSVAIGALIAVLVFAGLLIADRYKSRHRDLYIVSGLAGPATIRINRREPVELTGPGRRKIQIPEGSWTAHVTGAIEEEIPFEIAGGTGERWSDDVACVLNVGGSAVLLRERTAYTAERSSATALDSDYSYHVIYGEPFVKQAGIHFVFEPFPARLKIETAATKEYRTRLSLVDPENLAGIVFNLFSDDRADEAADLAGWSLRRDADPDLLDLYLAAAKAADRETEAYEMLEEGVRQRPVRVEWHRTYQGYHENRGEHAALIREYDGRLARESRSADLFYLRGRLAMRVEDGGRFYDQALAIDANHAYAHFAKGYGLAAKGDWRSAEASLVAACAGFPGREDCLLSLAEARLALRDFSGLEEILNAYLENVPTAFEVAAFLAIVHQAQGKGSAVKATADRYSEAVGRLTPVAADRAIVMHEAHRSLQFRLQYAAADFDNLLIVANQARDGHHPYERFVALLESDRLEEASKVATPDTLGSMDPFNYLAASLAWRAAGDGPAAQPWEDKAVELLAAHTVEYRQVAAWLRDPESATLDDIRQLTIQPQPKAVLLCAMLFKRDSISDAAAFKAEARKLNVRPRFPFHLVRGIANSRF